MSRKLRFFKDQIDKAGLRCSPRLEIEPDIALGDLERQLADHEHEVLEMNSNSEKLRQTYNELLEFKIVLEKASGFLVSSNTHAIGEEIELHESTYSNNGFIETASLLEQVIACQSFRFTVATWSLIFIFTNKTVILFTGNESWTL
jgi:V-type H+-transporting ATPase subunit a